MAKVIKHITDLHHLNDAEVAQFRDALPDLVAALRSAALAAKDQGSPLALVLPQITLGIQPNGSDLQLDLASSKQTAAHAQDNGVTQAELDVALLQCALKGNMECCRLFLKQGANPNVIQPKSGIGAAGVGNYHGGGNSPLHHAACNGHTAICTLLIENGADINIRNHKGFTPLYVSVHKHHRETGLYLVSMGADTTYFGSAPDAPDQQNNALHLHIGRTLFKGMTMHTAAIRLGSAARLTELLNDPNLPPNPELFKGLVAEARSAKQPDLAALIQAHLAAKNMQSIRTDPALKM